MNKCKTENSPVAGAIGDWTFKPYSGSDVVQARDACTEMWLPVDHHHHLAWVFVQRLIHQAMQLTKDMKRRADFRAYRVSAQADLRYDLWLISPCVDCAICCARATTFCVRQWLSTASHGVARLVDLFQGSFSECLLCLNSQNECFCLVSL
jgi:hypothetical protein